MISLPGSECWHFQISYSFLGELFWPPWFWYLGEYRRDSRDSRQGFDRREFEISPRSYLKSCWDSRRVFGRRDFEISICEYLGVSRQDLGKNLDEILRSRRDLGEILGKFLAAEIFRFRQISARISTKFWDLGENLGEFLAAEILKPRRDVGQNFAGEPMKNKMTFVSILSPIKLFFGPLVIQPVWYILKQLFTSVSVKVVDIYLTPAAQ